MHKIQSLAMHWPPVASGSTLKPVCTPLGAAVEGPQPLLWGLKYRKLGSCQRVTDTCAEAEQGVHVESEAGKGDEPGTACEDSCLLVRKWSRPRPILR